MISTPKKSIFFLSCIILALVCSCKRNEKPTIVTKLVTDGPGINDRSFNAAAWEGMLAFYGDVRGEEEGFGEYYDVVPCREPAQAVSVLRQVAMDEPDLIVMTGFILEKALEYVAPMYPSQNFLCIDCNIDAPNVQNFLFAAEEGSYLVGVAAALQAQEEGVQNPSFGFIGGVEGDIIADFEAGYVQGVRSVFPDAIVYDRYVNDWEKPDLAAEAAKKWYDEKGVYAIFSAAGASGNGTIAQAVAHRKLGKNVWAIGVDRDQFEEGSYGVGKSAVLTSMIKRVDLAVVYGLEKTAKNSFSSGTIVLGLKESAVGYTSTNPEFSSTVQKKMTGVIASIVMERIKVAGVRTNPQETKNILETVERQ
ncbi:MAG: BMP family ABC transporter substrate-binding protein [Treponema sp.]|nr:BMP family ABC transporter substrate-binding protein [Treponema sp.]